MPAELSGYKKLPGKARRYRTPSGDTISRRQYENLKFQRSGWKNWSDYQKTAKDPHYRSWAKAAQANQTKGPWYKSTEKFGKYSAKLPRAGLLEPDSEFNQAYLKARDEGFSNRVGGAFDEFLKSIGLREPTADYDVGDTP